MRAKHLAVPVAKIYWLHDGRPRGSRRWPNLALFAAWLAFDAIQEQLAEERERRSRQQAEAKVSAVVCIAPSIHAAAEGLFAINNAIRFRGNDTQQVDALVKLAAEHVHAEIERFAVRESVAGLGLDDRLLYLTIVGTLNVFVNISERPSPILGRLDRLQNQRRALMNLHTYLVLLCQNF